MTTTYTDHISRVGVDSPSAPMQRSELAADSDGTLNHDIVTVVPPV